MWAAARIAAQVNCASASPCSADPEFAYPKSRRSGPSPSRRTEYIDRSHDEPGFV
jgi:hypothetical protein